jgi:hypothetical protein
MGEWWSSVGVEFPRPFAPVCYGGSYAVKASNIKKVPLQVRKALVQSLSRADNIEEGHFAERTWAGLLSTPLSDEERGYVTDKAKFVNWFVAPDGGGLLGVLMEEDVFGPPKPLPTTISLKDENNKWIARNSQWQWPEIYRAHVVDSNHLCKRPTVEPRIPKPTAKARRAPTVAMCTSTSKDDSRYINEWIDFHVLEGFAHFYLYDTNVSPTLATYLDATRPGWSKYATVVHWPGEHQRHNEMWTDCFMVKARQSNHTWAANFDVDEFLVLNQHKHVVSMLQETCQNGSVHVEAFSFAPDVATGAQRAILSERFLNGRETYELSAELSPYGMPRPLLYRNYHRGEIGWDGTELSQVQYKVKTLALIKDVMEFKSELPARVEGKRRRTLAGHEFDTSYVTPAISGHNVASLFRFPFKSVPEYVYKKCRGVDNSTSIAKREPCEASRTFAITPGAWGSYRSRADESAWNFLSQGIPWYEHFGADVKGVSCERHDLHLLF